ncbi:MAG: GDP-L-fucose synthase family protein [Planctomycetota bacterium]
MFWSNKSVLVTGGAGFLGKFVCDGLRNRGVTDITVPRRVDYDLTQEADVKRLYDDCDPDIVLHLEAEVGGIGANRKNPGRYFYANMAMGLHMIEQGRIHGLDKFVQVGTICAYPKFTPVPFKEEDLWAGYPEETNAPYGVAKKSLLVMLEAYAQQYGFPGVYLLPVNLYGPHDNFDLESSHVIPALIRKFVTARDEGKDTVEVWGSGQASREFLYVEDCAEGILKAAEDYDETDPVNLGTDHEITIQDLAEKIGRLVGYQGTIEWDASKPDGQPRRRLDTQRAFDKFDFKAQTGLDEGLEKTIAWWQANAAANV